MEKICTRCNFRTPAARNVCQVCGHSKFYPYTSAAAIPIHARLDNSGAPQLCVRVLTDALNHLAADASCLVEKLTNKAKAAYTKYQALCASKPARQGEKPTNSNPVTRAAIVSAVSEPAPTTFGEDDLDTMIKWFKSYGVDRPLILGSRSGSDTELQCGNTKAA